MSCKIEVFIKTFNLDTKHSYIWRLNLMIPLGVGSRLEVSETKFRHLLLKYSSRSSV